MTAPFHLGEDVADQLAATALAEHPEAWEPPDETVWRQDWPPATPEPAKRERQGW